MEHDPRATGNNFELGTLGVYLREQGKTIREGSQGIVLWGGVNRVGGERGHTNFLRGNIHVDGRYARWGPHRFYSGY